MQTDSAYVYTFLRLVAGVIVLPYGMQKLFGWPGSPEFGPKGISGTLAQITAKNIPASVAWLVIIGQSLGSIALLVGFFARIAAGGYSSSSPVHSSFISQMGGRKIGLDQRREKGSSILYCFLQSCCSLSLRAVVRYQSIVG